jgi:hypothetical protein
VILTINNSLEALLLLLLLSLLLNISLAITAINMSNPDSQIIFCSDAGARDENKRDDVIEGLKAKSLEVDFFLTGTCTSRKRRSTHSL